MSNKTVLDRAAAIHEDRERANEARNTRIIFRDYWGHRHNGNPIVRVMLRAWARRLRELRP